MIPQYKKWHLQIENLKYPDKLIEIPSASWPALPPSDFPLIGVWRSKTFLVMVFMDRGFERLSVLRTMIAEDGRYEEGITWDEMQSLKNQCGRGDAWAVEVFPPDDKVVNVQNMRHMFILKEAPEFGWNKENKKEVAK